MPRCTLIATVLVLSVSLTRADAQESSRDSAGSEGYKQAVASGIEEFERGNISEAREHFMRAHMIDPNARTLRGLGMSEFELRNYVDAVDYLEQALGAQHKPLQGKLREDTSALLVRARGYVGELRLRLSPAWTALRVDGFDTKIPDDRRVRLPVGDHTLEFTAAARQPVRRAIKLRGEQVLELSVELPSEDGEKSALLASAEHAGAQPVERPLYKRWWLWTSVGVAVLAGGVIAAVMTTRDPSPRAANGGSTGDTVRF